MPAEDPRLSPWAEFFRRFAAYCPVPVSLIAAGPRGALWLTVAAPEMVPVAFGVKVTPNVHLPLAATVAPHGLVPIETMA